jgi:hypothetical protein
LLAEVIRNTNEDKTIRFTASLVLKNTVRNHLQKISAQELSQVKSCLLGVLQHTSEMVDTPQVPRTILKETIKTLSKIATLEFFNTTNSQFLECIFSEYLKQYS